MSGNREGGIKAARTNREKYGENFYAEIGAKGGRNGHTGGFAANRALARIAGSNGGKKSRRGTMLKLDEIIDEVEYLYNNGMSIAKIADKFGVSYITMRRYMLNSGILK